MLKKVAMNPDELIYGAKYIWVVNGFYRIVSMDDFGDAILCQDGTYWFFDDNLVGQLYGPIEFESYIIDKGGKR